MLSITGSTPFRMSAAERMKTLTEVTENEVVDDIEQDEATDEATEALDPVELDLLGVLAGRDLPQDVKVISVDEAGAYALNKIDKEIRKGEILTASGENDELKAGLAELYESRDKLLESLKGSSYSFAFRGILRSVRDNILEEAYKEFPEHKGKSADAKAKVDKDRDKFYRNTLIAAHLRSIEDQNGAKFTNVTPEYVEDLFKALPEYAVEQIQVAVAELSTGTRSGFESAAKENAFLS